MNKKKIIAFIMSLALVVGLIPTIAFADVCKHPNMETTVVEATCYEEGYTLYSCPDCGESFKHEVVPALDHDMQLVREEPATCQFPRYEWWECRNDNCDYGMNREMGRPLDSHGENKYTNIFEANCSKEGYIKTICCDCGVILSEEILPVNDNHAFHNGKCLLCGKLEFCEHTSKFIFTVEANC